MTEPKDISSPLGFAMAYAQMGWHVLPLEPAKKQPLGRLVPRGMLDATTDFQTIRSWWAREPKAGIGIALAQSGLVAVDIDPRNGGTDTFEQLQAAHGSLRSDVMAMTGGGGEHHVFVLPPGAQISLPGTLGPGVDLKANGYIVVEPSLHPTGRQYVWEASSSPLDGVAPSPLPDWLRSLRIDLKAPRSIEGQTPVDPVQARDAREALYVLDAGDYHQWVTAGMALHSTGWGHPAYAMWCSWSQQSDKFDATVCRHKWESFTAPDVRGQGVSLAWIFGQAQGMGWQNPAASGVVRIGMAAPPVADGGLPLVFSEDIDMNGVELQQLVEDTLTSGGLSVMYGESNSGKSFLACDMDCAIASGTEWLGRRTVQGAVLYVAGEGAQSIKMRVLAWKQEHGVLPALAVVPVAVNLLDPRADVTRVIQAAAAVEKHYGMPVVKITIDTLARAFGGGNENASEDMGAVIHNADQIRLATKAHVMFVHHAGKDVAKGSRGHSSLKAATDTEIEVTADDATKLHTARITKQRDLSSRGVEVSARFAVVEMGKDQWGKPVTTCVVQATDDKPAPKSHKAKASDLQAALVASLGNQPMQTSKQSDLVNALVSSGFGKSAVYRCIDQLESQNVLTIVGNRVHLNGNQGL